MAGFKNEGWKWLVVGLTCASACGGPTEAVVEDGGGGSGGSSGGLVVGAQIGTQSAVQNGTQGGTTGSGSGSAATNCTLSSGTFADGDVDANDPCQFCDPSENAVGWSHFPDGTTCAASAHVCVAGSCAVGCFIAGTFYVPAQLDPANGCQVCEPNLSTNAWTTATDGTACTQGGNYCAAGTCQEACDIAGTLVSNGKVEPGNPNACCNAGISEIGWTADLQPLDAGLVLGDPAASVLADLDGDGHLDLSVATTTGLDIFLGKGDGTFGPNVGTSDQAQFLATADVNGDGRPDLIAVVQDPAAKMANVTVLLNTSSSGVISFSAASYQVGYPVIGLAVGAFRTAGTFDIATITNTPATITTLLNDGKGAYSTGLPTTLTLGQANAVVAGKFAGGSTDQLAIADGADQQLLVVDYIGALEQGFWTSSQTSLPATGPLVLLAQADINRDGLADLLAVDVLGETLFVLLNSGSSTFDSLNYYAVAGVNQLVMGDFNEDGADDVAVVTGGITVLLNETAAGATTPSFAAPETYPDRAWTLAAGDVNGDGKLDLVVASNVSSSPTSGRVTPLLGSCP